MGDKCKFIWPKMSEHGAGEEASGDKCKNIRTSVSRVGQDKWETSGDKCKKGDKQGDKCKVMWPRAYKQGDKRETSGNRCKNMRPSISRVDRGNISRGTLTRPTGPRAACETRPRVSWDRRQAGDRCKITRPRALRVYPETRKISGR